LRSLHALVVIAPATIAAPVFTMVAQATRAPLAWARMASRTASEIWSAILSGWPSETDSEVKRVLDIALYPLIRMERWARMIHGRGPGCIVQPPGPGRGATGSMAAWTP